MYVMLHPLNKSVDKKTVAGLPEGWLASNAGDERQRRNCLHLALQPPRFISGFAAAKIYIWLCSQLYPHLFHHIADTDIHDDSLFLFGQDQLAIARATQAILLATVANQHFVAAAEQFFAANRQGAVQHQITARVCACRLPDGANWGFHNVRPL
jgi:hypothetical protein